MSQARGHHITLTAIILMVGLVIFILHAGVASTMSGEGASSVRMTVDPTVLPPIQPPGESAEQADKALTPVAENKPAAAATPEANSTEAQAMDATTDETTSEPEAAAQPAPEPEGAIQPESKPAPQPAPKATGPGTIKGVAIDSTDTGFTLTITGDRPVGDTSYMNLSSPRRLVIDLREPWTLKTRNVVRAKNGIVKHVVIGAHPDRLRFVVHFREAPKGKLVPKIKRNGNVLRVTVSTP